MKIRESFRAASSARRTVGDRPRGRFLPPSILSVACLLTVLLPATAHAQLTVDDVAVVVDVDGKIAAGEGSFLPGMVTPDGWLASTACAFFEEWEDEYDVIFVFTTLSRGGTPIQQGWPVQRAAMGIGRDRWGDQTSRFCAGNQRLKQAVNMGRIEDLPDTPDGLWGLGMSGMELMAHEFGHHWLATVNFDKDDGQGLQCHLRGYEPSGNNGGGPSPGAQTCSGGYAEADFNNHWSYYFNSQSVMYGSNIEDLGDGQFRFVYEGPGYGPLDQYLMGLRAPEEVGPLFLVETNMGLTGSSSVLVREDRIVSGTRVDFTIDDIIHAEGPRDPPTSPCHWKAAAILLVPEEGYPPFPQHVRQVRDYAERFEEFYDWATDHRGSMDFTLDGRGAGTKTCPAPGYGPPDDHEPEPDAGGPIGEPDVTAPSTPDIGPPPPDSTAQEVEPLPQEDIGESGAPGCTPGTLACTAVHWVQRCDEDGLGYTVVENCSDRGLTCRVGECVSRESDKTGGGCGVSGSSSTPPVALLLLVCALLTPAVIRARFLFRSREFPPSC